MIFKKAVRGMLPRKTKRGEIAMSKLTVFDGVPQPYNVKKKQVVPKALRVGNLTKGRDFCVLGDLASAVGWKRKAIVETLEEKRKARAAEWYEKKQEKDA
jgi:large subunit ribosomal protein L13Ae